MILGFGRHWGLCWASTVNETNIIYQLHNEVVVIEHFNKTKVCSARRELSNEP